MTKNEQIEEIAKIVDEMYNVYTTTAEDIAEGLYNAGYRKIGDDCVVITKAELKQYKAQVVKEFAEKVKEKALSHCKTINCCELKFIEETIYELLNEEDIIYCG